MTLAPLNFARKFFTDNNMNMGVTEDFRNFVDEKSKEAYSKLEILEKLNHDVRIMLETEKLTERLRWHPCTDLLREIVDDDIDLHVFSEAGKKFVDSLQVTLHEKIEDGLSCQIKAAVSISSAKQVEAQLFYHYSRVPVKGEGMQISFTLSAAKGYEKPKEIISTLINTKGSYPKSTYENTPDVDDEDMESFTFDSDWMIDIFAAISAVQDCFNHIEFLQLILAFPYHEDEWILDDRILRVIFEDDDDEPEEELEEFSDQE